MSTRNQTIIRVVLFLTILWACIAYVSAVLRPDWKGDDDTASHINAFYREPRHTIDVVFIGNSTYRNGIFPLAIWHHHGIPCFIRSAPEQSPLVSLAYGMETFRYQNPIVMVMDVRPILFDAYDYDVYEHRLSQQLDPMRWSRSKYMAVRTLVQESRTHEFTRWLFPLLRYHDRWKSLSMGDLRWRKPSRTVPLKGMSFRSQHTPQQRNATFMEPRRIIKDLAHDPKVVGHYETLIQRCREQGTLPVFITMPRLGWRHAHYQRVAHFAQLHQVPYLDYNLPVHFTAAGIDPATDFIDQAHLNAAGALKIARHLGAYLRQHVDLPDRRQDPAYASWSDHWNAHGHELQRAR